MPRLNFKSTQLLLFVFLFFYNLSQAQTYSSNPSTKVSFTIGLTATNLVKDSISYRTGVLFNAGFVYSLRTSDKTNVNLELLYSGKSVKTEAPIVKYRYFYLDLPLYLQYNLSEKIRANIGAQYSVFTNSIVSQIDGSSATGVNNKRYSNIKSSDYAFLLGGEMDITETVSMTARYTLSGSTFFEKNKPNFGVFNLAFRINFYSGYRQYFGVKKEQK